MGAPGRVVPRVVFPPVSSANARYCKFLVVPSKLHNSFITNTLITIASSVVCNLVRSSVALLVTVDDPARHPRARVPRLETLVVAPLAKIVDAAVDDDRTTEDRVLSAFLQRDDPVVYEDVGGVAVAVRQDVAQVAHVTLAMNNRGVAVGFLETQVEKYVIHLSFAENMHNHMHNHMINHMHNLCEMLLL
jgi:hypothetical protein